MWLRFILLSAFCITCHCFRQTRELPDVFKKKPEWDDLRVKWGFDPFNENNFQSLPRRESDAKDARFELLRDECKETERSKERGVPLFKGKRYWKNKDSGVVLIYDRNGYIAGVQAGIPKSAFENEHLQKKLMRAKSKEEEKPVIHRKRRSTLANTDQVKSALDKEAIFEKRRLTSLTGIQYLNNEDPKTLSPYETYRSAIQSLISKRISLTAELMKLMDLPSKEENPLYMHNFNDLKRMKRHTDTDLDLEETSESSTPSASNGTTRHSKPLPSTLHSRQSTPSSTENTFKKTTLSRSHERARIFPEKGQKSDSTAKSLGKSKATRYPTAGQAFESAEKPSGNSKTSTKSDIFPPRYYQPKQEQYRSRFLRKAAKQPKKPRNENSETKSPSHATSTSPQNTESERRKRSVSSMATHHPLTQHPERHHPLEHHPVTHPFVEEDGVIFFTIYFINPEHICDPERSRTIDHFEHWGTGSGLFIHNGTKSNSFIQIPRDERNLQREGPWKPEKCFFTQGKMYSYNFDVNEDCHNLCPLLLYYNKGRLTGFALLFKMDYSSPYVEHPDKGLLRFMFEKVPKCYYEIGRLTKLHFFLTSNYLSHRC